VVSASCKWRSVFCTRYCSTIFTSDLGDHKVKYELLHLLSEDVLCVCASFEMVGFCKRMQCLVLEGRCLLGG
jgi:hypothetical protein